MRATAVPHTKGRAKLRLLYFSKRIVTDANINNTKQQLCSESQKTDAKSPKTAPTNPEALLSKVKQIAGLGGGRGSGSLPEGAGHLPLNLIVASENETRPDNN